MKLTDEQKTRRLADAGAGVGGTAVLPRKRTELYEDLQNGRAIH